MACIKAYIQFNENHLSIINDAIFKNIHRLAKFKMFLANIKTAPKLI